MHRLKVKSYFHCLPGCPLPCQYIRALGQVKVRAVAQRGNTVLGCIDRGKEVLEEMLCSAGPGETDIDLLSCLRGH